MSSIRKKETTTPGMMKRKRSHEGRLGGVGCTWPATAWIRHQDVGDGLNVGATSYVKLHFLTPMTSYRTISGLADTLIVLQAQEVLHNRYTEYIHTKYNAMETPAVPAKFSGFTNSDHNPCYLKPILTRLEFKPWRIRSHAQFRP